MTKPPTAAPTSPAASWSSTTTSPRYRRWKTCSCASASPTSTWPTSPPPSTPDRAAAAQAAVTPRTLEGTRHGPAQQAQKLQPLQRRQQLPGRSEEHTSELQSPVHL